MKPPGGMTTCKACAAGMLCKSGSRGSTDVPEKYITANDGKPADVFKVMSGAPDGTTTCFLLADCVSIVPVAFDLLLCSDPVLHICTALPLQQACAAWTQAKARLTPQGLTIISRLNQGIIVTHDPPRAKTESSPRGILTDDTHATDTVVAARATSDMCKWM